jgi:ubiquinone/menaquinone biosynthesis C-methylase UbiE
MEEQKVIYLSEPQPFEEFYLAVREKEDRVYSDEIVTRLPNFLYENGEAQVAEWEMRRATCDRFSDYLSRNTRLGKNVLDLGCGNGWFSNWLVDHGAKHVSAVDLNKTELEQARRCFSSNQISFYHANIYTDQLPEAPFDLITVNACVQYFADLSVLLYQLKSRLAEGGEIHFLDSQFYAAKDAENAKQRSGDYYRQMGVPEMAGHYFHRRWDELESEDHDVLYTPIQRTLLKRFIGIEAAGNSPFPWIRIRN